MIIFLRNRTTNFDETWYTFHTYTEDGFEVTWAHITHKQKSLTNNLIFVTSVSLCPNTWQAAEGGHFASYNKKCDFLFLYFHW